MSSNPRLSVLVVACERPHLLQRVLEDLTQQSLPSSDFEVIVSDDGSHPTLESLLGHFSQKLQLSWIWGERRGPATARNRALESLHAPLTLFLNDDVSLAPNLLEQHLVLHARQHKPTAIMGTFHFPDDIRADLFHRVVEDMGLIGTKCMKPGIPLPGSMFWTGNLSLPTKALQAVEGFDEDFREPKGDDVDLGIRLLREEHLQLIFSEEAVSWHHHTFTTEQWWDRAQMVGRAQRLLAHKHQDPTFWPGGTEIMLSPAKARTTKARTLAQRPIARGLQKWVDQLVAGTLPPGTYEIPELDCSMRLPEQTEALLTAAVVAATHFLFQEAFWETEV